MTRRPFSALTAVLAYALAIATGCPAVAQPAAPPASAPPPPAAVTPTPGMPPVLESAQPTLGDDRETIAAAYKWLTLLDAGKAGAAWDVASAHLKSVVTRPNWIAGIADMRKPFGKPDARKAEKFARSHQLPGAPEGDYSIIEFQTEFANGKQATEQVIWMLEKDDVWRVSGYYIR
jgi:hypothetical protein